MTSIPVLLEKMCLGARGPLDGTDNDDVVVQILKGQASIAKQKVFSIWRALFLFLADAASNTSSLG